MLRLTDIKLDLDHAEGEIKAAVLKRLDLNPHDLVGYSVCRRAVDARKRTAIALIYTLDIEVRNEAALLQRFARDRNIAPTPDEGYRLKARAPDPPASRPVVTRCYVASGCRTDLRSSLQFPTAKFSTLA